MQTTRNLRTYRKQWALKQRHLADLVGFRSRSSIAELEEGGSLNGLSSALALEFIFGARLKKLFPHQAIEVEEAVIARAANLDEELRDQQDAAAERIRELLQTMINRASANLPL